MAEEDSLSPFPGFEAQEEEESSNDDDCPLPGDHLMLEDDAIDDGNVKRWEDGDETEQNGPEQELVAADIVEPRGK